MRINSMYNSPLLDEEEEKKKKPQEPFTDRFLKTRQIILTDEINKELADAIAKQLLILDGEDDKAPIYMYIDSPGGDVDAGFAIFDMIRFVKAPVYLIGMGLIASAATLVLLSVPKERRFALPNSRYLIHQPLGRMQGVATDIEIYAKDMEKIRAKINKLISDETGTDIERVTKDTERDYWLDSDEARDYGLVSSVITNASELNK